MRCTIVILLFFISNLVFSFNLNGDQTFPKGEIIEITLNELDKNKIVMIGDGLHGYWYYQQIVINSLNSWIDNIEQNSENIRSRKLVLFLEMGDQVFDVASEFIYNHEIKNYLEYLLEYGSFNKSSTDNIEFLSDLEKIIKRIEILNESWPNARIEFQIRPAEPIVPNFDMTTDEGRTNKLKWITYERDKEIAKNIISFLEINQDYKSIVFYGSLHLLRYKYEKSYNFGNIDGEATFDFFLAHYLTEKFGRDNVSVIYSENKLDKETNIVKSLPKKEETIDYILSNKSFPLNPCSIHHIIKSKAILNYYYNRQLTASNERERITNYQHLFYLLKHSYLTFEQKTMKQIDSLIIYPRQFKDSEFVKQNTDRLFYKLIENFNPVKNAYCIAKWLSMPELKPLTDVLGITYISSSVPKATLYNLPIAIELFENSGYAFVLYDHLVYDSVNTTRSDLNVLLDNIDDLINYCLVNTLWIASDSEKIMLNEALKNRTGLEFKDPKEWSIWWRSCFNSAKK